MLNFNFYGFDENFADFKMMPRDFWKAAKNCLFFKLIKSCVRTAGWLVKHLNDFSTGSSTNSGKDHLNCQQTPMSFEALATISGPFAETGGEQLPLGANDSNKKTQQV